ncbi:MAG: VWA domain-containing protein [Trichodesmium sp. ALOHA_ZT_67]|nr:VWA domain-containing protein [Trichodesmium sp. ALOHA_ZT_67]
MNIKDKYLQASTLFLTLVTVGATSATAASLKSSDVVVIVDEYGSMNYEQTWLGTVIPQLDTALQNQGIVGNRFGLVGFGTSNQTLGRSLPLGGAKFGNSAEFATATNSLLLKGGFEDGYSAIDFALNNYTFREGAAVNFILVTDEDRDNGNSSLNFNNILARLKRNPQDNKDDILLNAIVNANFVNNSLGVNSEGNAYIANGSGGYTTTQLPQPLTNFITSDFGTTKLDYIDLALDSGGTGWDLNQLRYGGLTGTSFAKAFIDIKVEEIKNQQIPEPGLVLGLLSAGVLGVISLGKKLTQSVLN